MPRRRVRLSRPPSPPCLLPLRIPYRLRLRVLPLERPRRARQVLRVERRRRARRVLRVERRRLRAHQAHRVEPRSLRVERCLKVGPPLPINPRRLRGLVRPASSS